MRGVFVLISTFLNTVLVHFKKSGSIVYHNPTLINIYKEVLFQINFFKMTAPMERIQVLDSIEKDIITCLNSAGKIR